MCVRVGVERIGTLSEIFAMRCVFHSLLSFAYGIHLDRCKLFVAAANSLYMIVQPKLNSKTGGLTSVVIDAGVVGPSVLLFQGGGWVDFLRI